MGVVRHPGSIGVRRGPDRSIGGMRRQGPVDRFDEAVGEDLSLDARNPESVMDQEVLGAALSQRDDKGVEPYFGWAQPGADFLGGVLSPDPVAYGWVDGALSQYHPEDGGAPPVDPLVLQRLQAELPWGRLRSGAQALGRLGSAVARPVVRMNPRGLVGGRAAVQAASPRPVVPMRPPAAPSTAATRAGRVGWVEPPPRLPPPSGRLGSVPSSQLSASARSGRHGWVEPPSPRPPSPAVAGRLGSVRPPPTAGPPAGGVGRAARPTVGMQWRRSQGVPTQGSSVVPHSDELPWFTTNRVAGDVARAREPGLDPSIRAIREQMAQGADPSKWQSSQYFDVGNSVSRYKSGSVGGDLMSPSGEVAARSGLRSWQPARARDAYWFAPEEASTWLRTYPERFLSGDIPSEIAGQMSRTPRVGTWPISVEPRPGGYSVHRGDYIDWVNPAAKLGKGA